MAEQTKKPTGLSFKRNGNKLTVTWKIGDKDYGDGQTFQYRINNGKWTAVAVGTGTTGKTIAIDLSNYYPNTWRHLDVIHVRIRGKRRPHDGKTPTVSEWATKDYLPQLPNKPKLTAEFSASENNACTFTYSVDSSASAARWYTNVQRQTVLVEASNVTAGADIKGWKDYTGSATITEDSSVINRGISYTRWFRVRARGPKGFTAWTYAKHIYAVPFQTKDVEASANQTDAGGYLCTATWKTPRDASHPVDAINVQYTFANPETGMTCPDGASWTDAQTLAYKDGSDAAAFSIDNVVGTDQCLFVRINTVHDRNTTYGQAALAAVGALATPTGLSVNIDQDTHRATITATNASQVNDSFLVVRYRTADNPDGFNIGIIPHGQTSVTVQCPAFSAASDVHFSVFAAVGTYTATTRADGTTSYAVESVMESVALEYGGSIPAAPSNVVLSQTATAGTIRVVWDWAWDEATSAELSWADHEDAWESTDEPDTYMIANTHASAWNISGLETGKVWYVRVRLASGSGDSETFGAYSDTVSIDLSSAPSIPILTLSSAVITEGGSFVASWAFTSTDGTGQASAEVAEVVGTTYTILAEIGGAQNVSIDGTGWQSGESHLLAVRVTSESGKQSAWSDAVAVTVAEPLEIAIASTSLVEQTETVDGEERTILALTEIPLSVTVTGAGEGGTTRVVIERAEDYHIDRPDESTFNGFEGETIAIYSQTGESAITISNDDLIGHLDDGASYRLIATVQDGLGQSAEVSQEFEVHWTHQALAPTATVTMDNSNMVAQLTPTAPTGAANTDVCDIYRLSADRPELIYPDAVFGTTYVDPYPTLGEMGGYRFVLRTANGDYITADNTLAWTDVSASLDAPENIIDFGTGRALLEFNTDLSHAWAKDFKETKYLGGSIQGDWNPAVSRTGTINTVVTADNTETIEIMRRLATYAGICHVRTKDGSSYAADVQVSESYAQDSAHKIISYNLSVTRVDSDGYDGMTLAEWEAANGLE